MAQDFALPIRRVILPRLKADPGVTALIPAAQIYPSTVGANPKFPFIRYGAPIITPFRASCLDSSSVQVSIHVFTKPSYNLDGGITDTAEDRAHRMASTVIASIDGATLVIDADHKVRIAWTNTTMLPDSAEADAWHAVIGFKADVAG